jgi:hypothetical protein
VAFTAARSSPSRTATSTNGALRSTAESDPRWRETLERYVRLGHMPAGVLDRLS